MRISSNSLNKPGFACRTVTILINYLIILPKIYFTNQIITNLKIKVNTILDIFYNYNFQDFTNI